MTTREVLTLEEFLIRFEPVKNMLNPASDWNGCLYDIYGLDGYYVENVYDTLPFHVWTLLDVADIPVLFSGYHRNSNPIGYLITMKPFGMQSDFIIIEPFEG